MATITGLILLLLTSVTSLTQGQTSPAGVVTITATSANVAEPGMEVKINILRWSADEQRDQLVAALKAPPAPAAETGRGERGGGGRGGRGGRGDASPPADPFVALATAIGKLPTIGYVWTNEPIGYAIKYAYRASAPDGRERIVFATDRRLGGLSPARTPAAPATDYQFTLIELRFDRGGGGEGKTSLTARVAVDEQARTFALENYDAAPAILRNLKR